MKEMTTNEQERRYSISEVADMLGVNAWTIRLWGDRFDILKSFRDEQGNIFYSSTDVKKIETIFRLTKKKGITIEKAKKSLESVKWEEKTCSTDESAKTKKRQVL